MGTCQLPLHRLNHEPPQLLTLDTPKRSSGWRPGVRHSALRENDRTGLQINILRRFCEPNSCSSSSLEKHWNPSWWCLPPVTFMRQAATFCKNVCLVARTSPFTKNIYADLPPTSLEWYFRAVWNAASWATVLILPQIKLNSQLLSCAYFFKSTASKSLYPEGVRAENAFRSKCFHSSHEIIHRGGNVSNRLFQCPLLWTMWENRNTDLDPSQTSVGPRARGPPVLYVFI